MAYTFISGATGGIGKAFSEAVARSGAEMFVTGRSEEKLAALKKELLSLGSADVKYFACDLTSEKNRREMYAFMDDNAVKFDKIINVAGIRKKVFLLIRKKNCCFNSASTRKRRPI